MPTPSALSPKRVEQMAAALAAQPDAAVRQAIKDYPAEDRIALLLAVSQARQGRGLQAEAETPIRRLGFEGEGSYHLRKLGIDGPVTVAALDGQLQGLPLEIRMAAKQEAIERRWLSSGVGARVPDDGGLSLPMQTWFRRIGLDEEATYSLAELEDLLDRAELTPTEKISIKTECYQRRMVRASGAEAWHERAQRLQAQLRRLQRLVRG